MFVDNNILIVCTCFKYNPCKVYELDELKTYLLKIVTNKMESIMDAYLNMNDNETVFLKMQGTQYYVSIFCPTDIYMTEDI